MEGKMKEWDEAIELAVRELGSGFDSHRVIQIVTQRDQRAYVAALAATNGPHPFHEVHSALGRRIGVVCRDLGLVDRRTTSPDIFGNPDSSCVEWTLD